jgi:hypothetical protein
MKQLIALLLVVICVAGCSRPDDGPVPSHILQLERTELISGERAAEIINHLHSQNVTPSENYVGRFEGDGHTATYYLSLYENAPEAAAELDVMVESMERGGHIFDHVRKRNVNDHDVWMALGMGQAHYFFARDNQLIWLAVDVPIAEDAVKSLF